MYKLWTLDLDLPFHIIQLQNTVVSVFCIFLALFFRVADESYCGGQGPDKQTRPLGIISFCPTFLRTTTLTLAPLTDFGKKRGRNW